jgi:hypothetical protein
LRRALRTAARRAFARDDVDAMERVQRLLEPALSFDPVAVKRFQKPAPPFVISPFVTEKTVLDAGDQLQFEVLFIGTSIPSISVFLELLVAMGPLGLVQGEGCFEVSQVESVSLDGEAVTLWQQQTPAESLAPEIVTAEGYLQRQDHDPLSLLLQFHTPARLMKSGKPLKSPRFDHLFPFMLRRVTSLVNAHCQLELLDDPKALLDAAHEVDLLRSAWKWQDWRTLGIEQQQESVGGFVGELEISGEACTSLLWIVSLASLFGLGKSAAYGAGHFSLVAPGECQL